MPETNDSRIVRGSWPPPPLPRHRRLARFGAIALAGMGWRLDFDGLPGSRGIVMVYPHTSNWDFVIGLLAKWAMDLPYRWIAKDSLFRGFTGATLGRLLRAVGGRGVDRQHSTGLVEELARQIESEDWCWLAITPEGTRKRRDTLRSGFYHLALRAGIPVALAFIDYKKKLVSVADFIRMSGDVEADLDELRRFYADKTPLIPAEAGTIAFRPEKPR